MRVCGSTCADLAEEYCRRNAIKVVCFVFVGLLSSKTRELLLEDLVQGELDRDVG